MFIAVTLSDMCRSTLVPPAGFEPALPPPEGGALSPELRGPWITRRLDREIPEGWKTLSGTLSGNSV